MLKRLIALAATAVLAGLVLFSAGRTLRQYGATLKVG